MLRMYDLISYVTRAKIRKLVLTNLKKPNTPTNLSNELHIHRSAVSRAILELENKNLVKCLNPEDTMGRFYVITDLGRKVLEQI